MTQESAAYLRITPRDPLIARDGRPFSAGLRMRSLDWIYPSVLAGSLRTVLGELAGGFPDAVEEKAKYESLVEALLQVAIAGPMPVVATPRGSTELYFPAPADLAIRRCDDGSIEAFAARPSGAIDGTGCDFLPEHGLLPTLLPETVGDDFKPDPVPAFWSTTRISEWLADDRGTALLPSGVWSSGFLGLPFKDRRTHVQMSPASGVGAKGMLFQTVGLDLARLLPHGAERSDWRKFPDTPLAVRVIVPNGFATHLADLSTWSPVGGERRIAKWEAETAVCAAPLWTAPSNVSTVLKTLAGRPNPHVRMMLATPALFDEGWRPGWLRPGTDQTGQAVLVGTVPETTVRVRLIGACVDRWRPLSGWSYQPPLGPKPMRRLAPAGSVYFFRVETGDPTELAGRWLTSVCDRAQDGRDGFGLALWGSWQPTGSTQPFETS